MNNDEIDSTGNLHPHLPEARSKGGKLVFHNSGVNENWGPDDTSGKLAMLGL